MNRARVRIDYHRGDGIAECEGCDIRPDVTRERLRQHVAATGHTAHFLVEKSTTYRPKHPPTEETDHA